MPFSDLPNEVIYLIIAPAVWGRGPKRAVRLRLVSKAWNIAVEAAIFDSGILDEDQLINRAARDVDFSFWQRYLVYRTLHNRKPPSTRLAVIRQLAERIVELRGLDLEDSQGVLRECVGELCHAALVFRMVYDHLHTYVAPEAEPIIRLDERSSEYQRALLSAAAYMNDLDVGRKVLSLRPDHSLPKNMKTQCILGFLIDPYPVAAYRGSVDFISMLLANESEATIQGSNHRATIAWNAILGNHMGVLDLALGPSFGTGSPDFMALRESLVTGLSHIPNIVIFHRCFDLVKDHLQYPCRPYNGIHRQEWLIARLKTAAERGAVAVMEYLVQQGAPINGNFGDEEDGFRKPISLAALNGHEWAVKWLLNKGADLHRSLQAAVAHGSRRIVQVLLEHGALDNERVVQMALIEAVKMENEGLFRLLVDHGATLEKATVREATEIAENEGLDSMVEFLKGYL
ncbi:hypothetical protein Hte_011594 [Hypoxylon texense]